jgi:hypothetical protein
MMMDEKLISAIEDHESNAETYGDLSEDRAQALDYYLGNPLGNEVEGRSQVVSRQVWDVVEWLKPQLADVFCSGDEVVKFSPRGPEDVKAAEQETDYINHIVQEKNNWFEVFYSWMHDALIQKTGYVKVYWDDSEDISQKTYANLTPDEFAMLLQLPGMEVIEQAENITEYGVSYTVKTRCTKPRNITKLCNLAPEYVLVSQNATGLSLNDPACDFVEHREYKTISQLRKDGFDVADDINDSGDGVGDWEAIQRDEYTPFRDNNRDGAGGDQSMRRVKVRECWIRIDYDEDGISELRHVIVVGTNVLLNEDADFIPIAALCPTPLSHRHTGLSVADAVMDLQRIQTALLRGSLDNQYLANNGRYAIDVNTVNMDDMLDSRAGGVVRVEGNVGASFFPLTHPTQGSQVVPMMEYMDKIAQKRTGVSDQTMGLNPNALNNQAGAAANMATITAAQQRIKFIARIFAETGMKALFQIVHATTLKNTRQAQMVEMRGTWVPVNPAEWDNRTDMSVTVGTGLGDKPAQIMFLTELAKSQIQLAPQRFASPGQIYNTLSRISKLSGFKDPAEFWTNPEKLPPQPPQTDPQVMAEQMRMQADVQKTQATMQMEMQKIQLQNESKLAEIRMNLELQASNDARDRETDQINAQLRSELDSAKMQNDQMIAQMKGEIDKYKADLDAQTKLIIASMGTQGTVDAAANAQTQEAQNAMLQQVQQTAAGIINMMSMKNDELSQVISGLQSSVLAQKTKRIIRDENGRAVAIEVDGMQTPIQRGPDGRVLGL